MASGILLSKTRITLMVLMVSAACMLPRAQAKLISTEPGALTEIPALPEGDTVLTVAGSADVRDLIFLSENLPKQVKFLDLSSLSITSYGASRPVWQHRTYWEEATLPDYIFFGLGLSRIFLPESLKTIGEGALAANNFTHLKIPAQVSKIGDSAFRGCSQLLYADMSQCEVSAIPAGCFAGCSSMTTVALPPNLKEIGSRAFEDTQINNLHIAGLTTLHDFALYGMENLKIITLSPSMALGNGVLMGDSGLTTVNDSPYEIPMLFAAGCSNLSADRIIRDATFLGAYSLSGTTSTHYDNSTIRLGAFLEEIEDGAFNGMRDLATIDATLLQDRIPATSPDAFGDLDCSAIRLSVATGTSKVWGQHEVWSRFYIKETGNVVAFTPDDMGNHIRVKLNSSNIEIEPVNGEPLLLVEIWNADGRLVSRLSGETPLVTIPNSDLPSGVLILNARTSGSSVSEKIMIK